jgi:hypothetical protein
MIRNLIIIRWVYRINPPEGAIHECLRIQYATVIGVRNPAQDQCKTA